MRGPAFENNWIHSTHGWFVPSLVEMGLVVLEKKILKYFQYNFTFSLLSSLEKGHGPSFEQTWIPSTQGCFVPSFVEIGPVVLEKKLKMWKVYRRTDGQTDRQTDGQTDNRRSEKLTWAYSSDELKRLWQTWFYNMHGWLLIVEPLVEYFRECFSWDFLTWIIWQEWPWPQLIPAILHTGTGCKLQLVTL